MTTNPATRGFLGGLRAGHRALLGAYGREVAFPVDALIFEEGKPADRFWILRTGSVDLDPATPVPGPGHGPDAVEILGPGELLGWSWLFAPYTWHLTARAASPVRALEFDAARVRALCDEDHEFGHALTHAVAEVVGRRLRASRSRLLDAGAVRTGAARART
ncbi:cyclic nucleotide-binding domain-containing protein [Streptomyces sp. NPDC048172]|uniref:cyclic nucleotide-binding domain-containing protein n=1 Tax=Streptomyces sp. NPDC048172 TaxID=3365505 RepID=UPI0037164ED2